MTTEETQTITIGEYFEHIKNQVSADFLQSGIERPAQGITCEQLSKHEIDACVVTYLDNDVFCVNPVAWANTEYYISDVFTNGDIRFKVFVGEKD